MQTRSIRRPRSRTAGWWPAGLVLMVVGAAAQEPDWQPMTAAGVYRAAAAVDSVFLDRLGPETTVSGGDWGAYLMARLGIHPLPADFGLAVRVDTAGILLGGRIGDIPPEARGVLNPLFALMGPDTHVHGEILLHRPGPRVVRFHLERVLVDGMPLPELLVATVMAEVGRQYRELTATGRDLHVEVPADAVVELVEGGVRLAAPPCAADPEGCPRPPSR